MTTNETFQGPGVHRYLTTAELAHLCGIAPSTARHWAAGAGPGFPPVVRLPNRAVLVERTATESWFEQREARVHGLGSDGVARRLRDERREAPVLTMKTTDITPDDDERFFTLVEFAAHIRQSPHTVGKWLRRGGKHFPKHVRLPNRSVLIERSAADRWLQERTS